MLLFHLITCNKNKTSKMLKSSSSWLEEGVCLSAYPMFLHVEGASRPHSPKVNSNKFWWSVFVRWCSSEKLIKAECWATCSWWRGLYLTPWRRLLVKTTLVYLLRIGVSLLCLIYIWERHVRKVQSQSVYSHDPAPAVYFEVSTNCTFETCSLSRALLAPP